MKGCHVRYWIALAIAITIIIGLQIYLHWIGATVDRIARQQLRGEQATGKPEASDADPDAAPVSDFGTELPDYLAVQIAIADMLAGLWFIWMPLAVAGCLIAAWLLPATTRKHVPK